MHYLPIAKVLYNSLSRGLSGTIAATGDSGTALIDLREVLDVTLSVNVGVPTGTTPGLVVGLDLLDACGNWIPQAIKTAQITATGLTVVYGGLHSAGATMVVLTAQGRISWTLTGTAGPTFPGVAISLIGR